MVPESRQGHKKAQVILLEYIIFVSCILLATTYVYMYTCVSVI